VATGFFRQDGELTCDGVPLAPLAEKFRTPLYMARAALSCGSIH
jgi:diaminopimelate decarboxylase